MKTLSGVNLTHKQFGLTRVTIRNHSAFTAMIHNFRKLIWTLGYDCSLLDDSEILSLEDAIFHREQNPEESYLVDILEFLVVG